MNRLNYKEAAKYLGVTPKTLAVWRKQHTGPAHYLVGNGRKPRAEYDQVDLDKWAMGVKVLPLGGG